MKDKIWIYSKLHGTNEFLFETDFGIEGISEVFNKPALKKHKQFAYALVSGIEIKLFSKKERKKDEK